MAFDTWIYAGYDADNCLQHFHGGENLWRLQSLPLDDRKIYDAKILLNLSLAAPFYILAVILSIIALHPGLIDGLFILCVPAAYILFSAVAGLSANMALPLLQWESEVQVVKQSGARFNFDACGFCGMAHTDQE